MFEVVGNILEDIVETLAHNADYVASFEGEQC